MLLASLITLLPLISAYVTDSEAYRNGSMGSYPAQTYSTHPGEFPIFNFNPFPDPSPPETSGYILLAPRGANVSNRGALILDWSGGLVWDGSEYGEAMAFNVQTYLGNQVLALWTGQIQGNGWGRGRMLLLDQQYQVVANFTTTLADQGQGLDFHEAQLTPNDTALVLVYNEVGDLLSGVVQELNVTTGQALFTWDSADHVPTEDCYIERGDDGSAWDYIVSGSAVDWLKDPCNTLSYDRSRWPRVRDSPQHLNSIDKDSQGNYLLSSRHCSSLFYVAPNGTVLWTLGGRYSNFTGSSFSWQHDARWHGPNTISLFDNAANTWEETGESAMGVILELDFETMSVTQTNFTSPTGETSPSQGGFLKLTDDNGMDAGWLAGWGSQPYLTEFAPDGAVRWHAQFGTTTQASYRAVKAMWRGYPITNPNMSVSTQGEDFEVLVSWSGATEVGYWLLLADGEQVGRVEHEAFEDTITVRQTAVDGREALQVAAYTGEGGALGWSDRYNLAESRFEAVPASEQDRTEGTQTFAPSATSLSATTSTGPGTTGSAKPVAGDGNRGGGGSNGASKVEPGCASLLISALGIAILVF